MVSFLNARGLSSTFCFFTLFSADFCRAWPYFFDLVTALLDFFRSAGFSDFFIYFRGLETSVGKRSLIINPSMIVTTSNIPERIANFVSIFNRHIH